MENFLSFEKAEIEKLLDSLGLLDNIPEENDDPTEYFNAWHFGKKEEEGDYTISTESSIVETNNVC